LRVLRRPAIDRSAEAEANDHYNGRRVDPEPETLHLLAFALIVTIGVSIGAVGVGGFLVVPVLVFLDGRPLRDAVIAATVSFVGAGLVALVISLRRGGKDSRDGRSFLVAAAPGALLGATLLRVIDATTIGVLITIAVGLAGIGEWFGLPRARTSASSPLRASVDGALTGMASALTGTSGPLIAMPLLAFAGMPIRERIRVGQVAQLPIALTATIVFVVGGDIAWTTAATSAAALAVGVLGGMTLTPRVAPVLLSRTAALLMLATACSTLAIAIFRS
jgi:uncharacterized membrane protein YfcA